MSTKTPNLVESAPAEWTDVLARSEAQIAAGNSVPSEPVLARLRASIARMKAKHVQAQPE